MSVLEVIEPEIVAVGVQAIETIDVIRTEVLAVEVKSVEALIGAEIEVITDSVQMIETIERKETEVVTDQQSLMEIVTVGIQGPPGPSEEESVYAKRVDFVSDTLIYRGESAVGTANAQPLWRICRITIGSDDDVTEEWAGGTAAFDKAWTDRAALGYS